MNLNRDTHRLIALDVPYRDLSAYCRSSSVARSICREPTFWMFKTLNDFPWIVHNAVEFRAIPERTDRLRYLNIYNSENENRLRNAEDEFGHIRAYNRSVSLQMQFPLAQAALKKQIQEYLELKEYIHQQRRERFENYGDRLPVIHDWRTYGKGIHAISIDTDGNPYYTYVSTNRQEHAVGLESYFGPEDIPNITVGQLLSYEYPKNYDDFIRVLMDANPGLDLTQVDVQPDDLILLLPAHNHESYVVYRQLNGSLGVALAIGYSLPNEVLDMFARLDIHSRADLYDLYGEPISIVDTIDTNIGELALAKDENEYKQLKRNQYHESMLPSLLHADEE